MWKGRQKLCINNIISKVNERKLQRIRVHCKCVSTATLQILEKDKITNNP